MNDRRRYRKNIVPHQKRTIPVYGTASYINGKPVKDQSNTLFRCWNCGFLCESGKTKLGDGVGYTIVDEPEVSELDMAGTSFVHPQSDPARAISFSIEDIHSLHLMQCDSEGNPVTIVHNFVRKVTQGCPHCGCLNWK